MFLFDVVLKDVKTLMNQYSRVFLEANTPLRLTASFWKLFKILSYEILEAKFGFSTQTLVQPQVLMLLAVVVLTLWRHKVWKSVRDLTVKMTRGAKFNPERFLTVNSLINVGTLHCHKINITNASRLKTCT